MNKTIRREPTYLTTDVWRALLLIAKTRVTEQGLAMTPDELADTLLREVITERYPRVFEHQKAVTKMEAELIATLK